MRPDVYWPVFEIVAAREITVLDPAKTKGDNPRILHLRADSEGDVLLLEVEIQKRRWLPRQMLTTLAAPTFHVRGAAVLKDNWLDHFSGWLGRSYTRVALPDAFNDALKRSRIREAIDKMLKAYNDDLYGVYFSIASATSDAETEWQGRLGEMPSPYLLDIMLVVYDTADAEKIKQALVKSIFTEQITDTDTKGKICRGTLARRYGIFISQQNGIDARNTAEITLTELKPLVRYSLVDHLSDSAMAAV